MTTTDRLVEALELAKSGNAFEARMQRFADQLHGALTRQLEQR